MLFRSVFADPTKSLLVRDVLQGARALHPAPPKQARPLQLDVLEHVDAWLANEVELARSRDDRPVVLRALRDRSLILLGFWRGFRADELSRLMVEQIEVRSGDGLRCYLPRSKGDRAFSGRYFECPALPKLCPVTAYTKWVAEAELSQGAVFRRVSRTGQVGRSGLHPGSFVPLLRRIFASACVVDAQIYTSHSLRRGFAGWARNSGWDLKEMMDYVGWADVKSAMRYLDERDLAVKARFANAFETEGKSGER